MDVARTLEIHDTLSCRLADNKNRLICWCDNDALNLEIYCPFIRSKSVGCTLICKWKKTIKIISKKCLTISEKTEELEERK